jgi:hypothetical protein
MEISKVQKKLIHIGIGKLGITDEIYRDMLQERFKVNTCKGLQYQQASSFISELVRKGFRIRGQRPACRGLGAGRSKACLPRPWRRQVKGLPAAALAQEGERGRIIRAPNLIYLPTRAQLSMIDHLRADIRWKYYDGYQRFVAKMLGRTSLRTKAEAQKIIESLKGIRKSQERGYGPKTGIME